MKKVLPIILVGAVVLGAGAYFLSQNKGQLPTAQPEQQNQQESTSGQDSGQQERFTGTLKKMLGLGKSLKCSWRRGEEGSGTTWVKNEMFYNEVTSEGQQGRVIFKDDCMWSWQEGKTQGVKMCFSPEQADEMLSGETESSQESEDSQTETTEANVPTDVEYNCQPAVVSDAKFNPPKDIQFMDMDQLMQGMQE